MTHQNAPPLIILAWYSYADHFIQRSTCFNFNTRVFAINAADT